jgi:hypothetical protein
MKHKSLLYKASLVLVVFLLSGFAGLQAQTLLYSNDFESGLNGSTIVGNGAIEASGNTAHGQVFHNAAGGQAVRTNYLTLPTTIFADLKTAGTNALSISFWVNKGTATGYYWCPVFSAYAAAPSPNNGTPMMVLQTRGVAQTNLDGTWSDYTDAQNVKAVNTASTTWIDDANWHFYTATFTTTSVKVYIDGAIMNEWTLSGTAAGGSAAGLFSIGSALPYVCLGGNQAWNWGDPDPAFLYDKLKIYSGALTTAQINSLIASDGLAAPVLTSSKSALYFDDKYTSESIVVNGANLGQDITITAPAGITVNPTTISKSAASDVAVSVTWNGTTSVNGNITLTSGSTVTNVSVKTSSNTCYTPAYATGNMIADPTFSAASLVAGGFGGWGTTVISYKNAYCGRGTAYIYGNCSGSIDRTLSTANGNALVANSTYRLRALVNSKASASKTFQFQVEGVSGATSIYFPIKNTNGWKQIDTTFTTAATVSEHGIYFNSCNGTTPLATDTCFIDNYELYKIPNVTTGLNNVTVNNVSNFVRNNKVVSSFNLDAATEVSVALYNINGMLIESKKSMGQQGKNERVLNASLSSGVYMVKTTIDGKFTINKIIL